MTTVTVHEAKTNLSRLIADALAGNEVVIARGNVPAVRLVPVNAPSKRRFGVLAGRIAIDSRFDEPLPDAEIDAWDGA